MEVASTIGHGGHAATAVRRYVCDEDYPKAAYFDMPARGHWPNEDQPYRDLDVVFLEDACRVKKGYAAINISTIRKLAMQITREHVDKNSLKENGSRQVFPSTI